MVSKRGFIKSGGVALMGIGLMGGIPAFLAEAAASNKFIDLDGRFGLHPSMTAFEPLFKEKRLAIVHGIGSPNKTRSHFDAQDYMEAGTPFNKGTSSGWLNRAIGLLGHDAASPATPFQAVSLTSSLRMGGILILTREVIMAYLHVM